MHDSTPNRTKYYSLSNLLPLLLLYSVFSFLIAIFASVDATELPTSLSVITVPLPCVCTLAGPVA